MTTTVATRDSGPELLERVVIGGDLSKLTPADRLRYYREVCASMGLNPLTKPFEYLYLNSKLVLYARRDATDQLRKRHHVSIRITAREQHGDVYAVVALATDKDGRTDEAIGAVATGGLKGNDLANALMKAETKSKRRVTLSICGLGMLDETEVDTIPDAHKVESGVIDRPAEIVEPFFEETVAPGQPAPVVPGGVPYEEVKKLHPTIPVPEQRAPRGNVSDEEKPEISISTGAGRKPGGGTIGDTAPLEEWLRAMTVVGTPKALQDLWKGVTAPALWSSWSPAEQEYLTAAKDAAKQRLGVAGGPAR
jgi:hypothetical protein